MHERARISTQAFGLPTFCSSCMYISAKSILIISVYGNNLHELLLVTVSAKNTSLSWEGRSERVHGAVPSLDIEIIVSEFIIPCSRGQTRVYFAWYFVSNVSLILASYVNINVAEGQENLPGRKQKSSRAVPPSCFIGIRELEKKGKDVRTEQTSTPWWNIGIRLRLRLAIDYHPLTQLSDLYIYR